ncbi:MAG: hypothetical protein ACLRXC_12465 [[Clostridium] leptum]
MERIAEKMPELSYIDEDYGQLEAGAEEDHYPVTFPCVLVGNAESDWNDLGYGVQKSESLITIRLAIDCYDDTHYTSGTYDKVRERQLKAKELYKALQEFQCTEETSPLVGVNRTIRCRKHQGGRDGFILSRCMTSRPCSKGKVHSPVNRESWTAVRRGFLTFGTGFTSKSFSSRHLHRIMDMIRSSEMKNSWRDNTFRASSKRRRCTSVQ